MKIKDISELKNPAMRKQAQQQQRVRGKILQYPFTLDIPIELRSKNEFTGNGAGWKRSEAKKEFIRCIAWLVGNLIDTPHEFQWVTFTRVLGKGAKRWDDNNMEGGDATQLQDALKKLGFYVDDSPKWIRARCLQDYTERPEKGYTRIKIEMEEWK